ncbi:MAG: DsbE family thiol:disulfide interchange protein, partial [Alphaproteobacteria bacterium]
MRLKFLLPVLVFVAIAGIMWYALFNLDPTKIPSELIAKPAPEFALEPVPDFGPGLATADLKKGKVTLVNVFASWCISCIAEHPLLVKFAAENPVEI